MDRVDRLPTRVNKACERCKRQKQRCDFERPCRHCIRARTECTTITSTQPASKRRRLRKDADRQAILATTHWEEPTSHLQSAGQQNFSTQSHHDSSHNGVEATNRDEVSWNTATASNEGGSQASPARPPSNRADSSLPGVDADSALAITRKIFRFQKSPAFKERATSAIPGGGYHDSNGTNSSNNAPAPLIPVLEIIGIELPAYEVCNKILETYFSTVHWFSLVVYEPKFRSRYNAIVGSGLASRSDHGFLLLLLMVLILGCWYTPAHKTGDLGLSGFDMEALRSKLLKVVQRDFMELMDEDSLEFVQLCALLGSFYLYHGRPRSSFSILGAATKTSQAMELHRDSEMKWSHNDREERKRVWWTIYTWDRFATITYGRPLGINDKDCNVSMPSEIVENVHFDPLFSPTQVCLSTYQCRLNLVYKIASPLLEDIYGIRTSQNMHLRSQLPQMVATANQALLEWQQDLPLHLSLDHLNDLKEYSSIEEKMHSLQALSLQLTYDNLMIVLHRQLLAGQGYDERWPAPEAMTPNSQYADDVREVSFRRCLTSALRISNVQRKTNLFLLARTTHLVSFLGMNLFTASVVLFICALSDTLSDTAQEAKRGLKRTLQMQKALSNHASLSMQSSRILEDLVQLILKREMEEMLRDISACDDTHTAATTATSDEEVYRRDIHAESAPNGVCLGSNPRRNANVVGTNEETPHPEGSHFKQSLETLQRVFHESSLPRHQIGLDGDLAARRDYGEFPPADSNMNLDGMMGSQDFGFNDGGFTRVEDLGQFWLWNLDDFQF